MDHDDQQRGEHALQDGEHDGVASEQKVNGRDHEGVQRFHVRAIVEAVM